MGSDGTSSGNVRNYSDTPKNFSLQQNLSGFIDIHNDSMCLPVKRNAKKHLGAGTYDRFDDINGGDYQGLDADSNEKCWNDYESITSKKFNNQYKISQMSPFHNGSSSSSSNKGGFQNDNGYFSSGDVNFGSGGSGHMSSFSDINNNKSIKSSLNVGGNNP